jgi:hypothetical protein
VRQAIDLRQRPGVCGVKELCDFEVREKNNNNNNNNNNSFVFMRVEFLYNFFIIFCERFLFVCGFYSLSSEEDEKNK